MTPPLSRRDFLASSAAAATLAAASTAHAGFTVKNALPRGPADKVTLGKSGIQVSVVGMGTGSVGVEQSSNQVRLGTKGFTKVVRHALDRGLTLFDVADQYGSHVFLREALKGVPRENYVIQTKTHAKTEKIARSHIERYCHELGVEMIDIVLLHCMTKKDWHREHQGSMDYLRRAKEEGLIRAHGTSNHGMDPLRTSAREPFVEVNLARINPEGLIMDDKSPDEVASELQEFHDRGVGVIGMKVLGEGRINTPDRIDNSLQYVLGLGTVDAFVIGFESTEQVDDLCRRTERALADLRAKQG
jgi:aryl-alcohol dehydrogenase-like predicted oxidoreductase